MIILFDFVAQNVPNEKENTICKEMSEKMIVTAFAYRFVRKKYISILISVLATQDIWHMRLY